MARPKKMRTPAQNRRIWALVGELKRIPELSDDDVDAILRGCVFEVSGQHSTTQLSEYQAGKVIGLLDQHLGRRPERMPWGPRGEGPRKAATISPRQQAVLRALFQQAGMGDMKRQRTFCMRQCKVPWPQTQQHADALMAPLTAMVLRRVDPGEIWRRAQALRDRPELDTWQQQFVPDLCRQFAEAEAAGNLGSVLSPHKLLKLCEAEDTCGVGQ